MPNAELFPTHVQLLSKAQETYKRMIGNTLSCGVDFNRIAADMLEKHDPHCLIPSNVRQNLPTILAAFVQTVAAIDMLDRASNNLDESGSWCMQHREIYDLIAQAYNLADRARELFADALPHAEATEGEVSAFA